MDKPFMRIWRIANTQSFLPLDVVTYNRTQEFLCIRDLKGTYGSTSSRILINGQNRSLNAGYDYALKVYDCTWMVMT